VSRASVEEYAAAIRPRYLASGKAGKKRILDEFCETTGYHRKAAIRLLRRPLGPPRTGRRGAPRRYGPQVIDALVAAWEAVGRIGSKRLAPFLSELVPILERHRELVLTDDVRASVLRLGPSTIDRLLRPYRRIPKRRVGGHPPTLAHIRRQVPIRTSSEWKGAEPGYVQADLVEHCGDEARGFFLYTLTVVDVATSWTVCRPVKSKSMDRVRAALHRIRTDLPMELKHVHTDNGSEFVNEQLTAYCQKEGIGFTRGRPYRKNDQAFVEQRNWTAVRQAVGYVRYSSKEAYALLEQLYEYQRLYLNFFQPVRKLVSRERVGARVVKRYDQPATPYQRLLATGQLDAAASKKLDRLYQALNPAKLRHWIEQTTQELWEQRELPRTARAYNAATHISVR
jgi:transposase InsO family protein